MFFRNTAHAGGCVVPPLLLQQKGLVDAAEGPLHPTFVDESPVLRQWFDATLRLATVDRVAARVVSKPGRLADCLVNELRALARRVREVCRPVQIGFSERGR